MGPLAAIPPRPEIVGILDSLSGTEFIIVGVLAFLVLGPEKLPDVMRKVGRFMGEVRRMTSGFQDELKAAKHEFKTTLDDPDPVKPGPVRSTETSENTAGSDDE